MKTKRLFTVILAVLFIVSASMLFACNPIDNSADSQQQSSPSKESSTVEAETVTIRLLVDGEVFDELTGKVGAKISLPTAKPTKEHKTFVKWDGYKNGARFTENTDWNAVFEDIIYTVKFTDEGKTVKSIEGKYGETYEVPADLENRAGYIFKGWKDYEGQTTIEGDAEYAAQWLRMQVAYTTGGTYDNSVLTKDSVFDTAISVTDFAIAQNSEEAADPNKAYEVSLAQDGTYLYVYIYSADTDTNDNDRLSFYVVKNGSTSTTLIETYPNKAEPYSKGKDACSEINVGKVEGGYALKAKIELSTLAIDSKTMPFGVRFIDKDNKVVYLSEGATADDGATKVANASNLPVWVFAADTAIDSDTSDWDNVVKTELTKDAFTAWVGSVPNGYSAKIAFKATQETLFAYVELYDEIVIAGTDEGQNDGTKYSGDAIQLGINTGNGRYFYCFDYRGDGVEGSVIRVNAANETIAATGMKVYTKLVENGWAAELSIPLDQILGVNYTFDADNPLRWNVLLCNIDRDEGEAVNAGAYGTFKDGIAWVNDTDGYTLVLNINGTYEFAESIEEPTPEPEPDPVGSADIAEAGEGEFNAENLEKDAIFATATEINAFQKVQGDVENDYALYLVHDGTYLYVYIYSEDSNQSNVDRVTFYLVKKGTTGTVCVQTYPNKGLDGATDTDMCVAINAGKIEGGYAVKAKIALENLEVYEGGKIDFGVRFVNDNGSGNSVFLSESAVATDGSSKVTIASDLPDLTLTGYVTETPNPEPEPEPTPVGSADIAKAGEGEFNAENLEKDAIFATATEINKFQKVQGDVENDYALYLVHDNEYLYVYIYSADSNQTEVDRVTFYLVKKGTTGTVCVQTYPNKGLNGSTDTDMCVAINAGKVEGGYAVKAKIALENLEIYEGGKIDFGVRFVNDNGSGNSVFLSESAVATDGATKVTKALDLPDLTLTDYVATEEN